MNNDNYLILLVTVYTLAVIAVGLWKGLSTKTSDDDYFLANKSFGSWLTGFSGAVSAESGWVMLGLVGTAYSSGPSTLWLIPGCFLGYLFNWFILAPRVWDNANKRSIISVTNLIADDGNKTLRWIIGLIILVFMLVYASAQFNALGKALNGMFDLPYVYGVIIGTIVVGSYTITGGFRASVWTDLIQALLMFSVLIILPLYAYFYSPSENTILTSEANNYFDTFSGKTGFAAVGFVAGWMGIGLAYPGQPHVISRMMGAKSKSSIYRAGAIATLWSSMVFLGAILLGMGIRKWMPGISDPEQAIVIFASEQLSPVLGAFILAAIIAAIASTADSQLLASTSAIKDLFPATSKLSPRTLVLLLVICAGIFAAYKNRVVFEFVLYAWSVLGATIGPAMIGKFIIKANSSSILAGVLVGLFTVLIWKNTEFLSGILYELIPAVVFSILTIWIVNSFRNEGSISK